MTHAQHELQPAAGGLDKVIASAVRKAPAGDAPLLAWPVACGSAVAARTWALDFLDGILRVEVPEAGWRTELQVFVPRYLVALNRFVVKSSTCIAFCVYAKW